LERSPPCKNETVKSQSQTTSASVSVLPAGGCSFWYGKLPVSKAKHWIWSSALTQSSFPLLGRASADPCPPFNSVPTEPTFFLPICPLRTFASIVSRASGLGERLWNELLSAFARVRVTLPAEDVRACIQGLAGHLRGEEKDLSA
jgi:hypothetical protein